ncbi:hypothetical protein F4776DRAFT_633766 [Hypoxylon sp. NC0597]|nr:hypothetical protein F4776DRAFT_633766 [Hypoxylon sp. NC0597]
MDAPTQDHRALSPPFVSPHAPGDNEPHRIIVEPTPENQRIYNEIRQTHERLYAIRSSFDESETLPILDDATAQDTDQVNRRRGRKRRPLDTTTRLHIALKRKLRLACPQHSARKVTVRLFNVQYYLTANAKYILVVQLL